MFCRGEYRSPFIDWAGQVGAFRETPLQIFYVFSIVGIDERNFGNGRLVRNLFEKTIEKQATRLAKINNIDRDMMITIVAEDIP